MASWQLLPEQGGAPRLLPPGKAVLGRGAACEIRLDEETISRQHAELSTDAAGVSVRDLGSSNGVQVNGVKLRHARLAAGDMVTFGAVAFRVAAVPEAAAAAGAAWEGGGLVEQELPKGTRVRAIDVRSGGGALARLQEERLRQLLELARRLSGEIELEPLLVTVVEQAALLLPADRVALLLLGDGANAELRLAHWRNRLGSAAVEVPRSIADRAVREKSPIATECALDDQRFQSGSVVRNQVRAALCVPLLADQEQVLGVLYVDSLTQATAFSDADAALCLAFGGLVAVSVAKAHFAEAARREVVARVNFERFFAPDVAARIAAQRSGVRPSGERRPVTVLYSDVRGFTALAESLPPEVVAEQLSEYFAAMVELVFEYGGTLDKFIGDALLALWGAPLPVQGGVDRALATARAMQREMAALNLRWLGSRRPVLSIGIGLHHGEAFTGTIGSPRRLEYTVIGDVVNVAARLCEAAAAGEIALSEEARSRLTAPPVLEGPERLALRGREEAVLAYRLGESS